MDVVEKFVRTKSLNAKWKTAIELKRGSLYEYPVFFICENAKDVNPTLLHDDVETLRELVRIEFRDADLKPVSLSTLVVDCPYIEILSEIIALFDLFAVHPVPPEFWEE